MTNNAIKYGAIIGGVSILLAIPNYLGMIGTMGGGILGFIKLLVVLGLASLFVKQYRDKALNGFITFKNAFIFTLITLITATLIELVTTQLYYAINPDSLAAQADKMVEGMYGFIKDSGLTEEQLEQTLKGIEESIYDQATVKGFFKAFAMAAIFNVVISLIIAAIFKKEEGKI
ncbi:MAG: DUF4199 domain-containing protein [Luteibaculaceae bacterium]